MAKIKLDPKEYHPLTGGACHSKALVYEVNNIEPTTQGQDLFGCRHSNYAFRYLLLLVILRVQATVPTSGSCLGDNIPKAKHSHFTNSHHFVLL